MTDVGKVQSKPSDTCDEFRNAMAIFITLLSESGRRQIFLLASGAGVHNVSFLKAGKQVFGFRSNVLGMEGWAMLDATGPVSPHIIAKSILFSCQALAPFVPDTEIEPTVVIACQKNQV